MLKVLVLHGRAVVPGAARAMRPNASSARRPRSARGPVAHGTSTRQNRGMPAWLLCRRERPARRDDGHGGGAGARVGPPGVHRLRDVGDGRAVALHKERGQALRSGTIGATARPRHGQGRKSHLRTPQRCTYARSVRGYISEGGRVKYIGDISVIYISDIKKNEVRVGLI